VLLIPNVRVEEVEGNHFNLYFHAANEIMQLIERFVSSVKKSDVCVMNEDPPHSTYSYVLVDI
jgi:hypothetical protein